MIETLQEKKQQPIATPQYVNADQREKENADANAARNSMIYRHVNAYKHTPKARA